MKHLKTYESYWDLTNEIKLWMDKHKLEKVDLNFQLDDKAFINMIVKEGNTFYVIYHWYGDLLKSSFNKWTGLGKTEVLDFLENMTPEEIEEQRIRNEAEKFNL